MLTCINKKDPEYQALKNKSGIQEFILEAVCRDFLDKYDRFPNLDELPQANSEPYLRDTFGINQHNGASIDNILSKTETSTIEEANAVINNEYRDLEVSIIPINKEAIVDIEHRPTADNFESKEVEVDESPNDYQIFNNAIEKLASIYGIKFNSITDAELNSEQWRNKIPDAQLVNAFIYNGEIYINLDRNSVDAPVHEMVHILIGSMRFTNPSIYQDLIDLVQKFPNYQKLVQQYPNRSRNDVNEEIFITEVSRYIAGLPSNISGIDYKLQYEVSYNIKRVLDSVLMGQDSVKTLSNDRLFNLSLKQIAKEINSSIMTNNFRGTLDVEGSELHRKLNNIKADLIEQKLLKEDCD